MQRFVVALNSVGSQPWAVLVLLIGCGMFIGSKRYGLDTSAASAIVGAAINMLTTQVSRTMTHEPGPNQEPVISQTTGPATFQQPDSK